MASDIGAKAFDLHCYGDGIARVALREVAQVNPEMLAWLRDRLLDITQQRQISPRKHQHGRDCPKVAHLGNGYLHDADDDRPYDVDGAIYCGRCHAALSTSPDPDQTPRRER